MLRIENISKFFSSQSDQAAVKNLNLEIVQGEFLSLLGPSGCGKTTLLRIIAGLETPTSGKIFYSGQDITTWPAQKRPFNLIFQKYALFPHFTVFDNIAFGLRVKKVAEREIQQRVQSALNMINMAEFSLRFPNSLSGGQAQRVALARALVNKPDVLLLDEPLAALDRNMRVHLQSELRQLQRELGITFIFVTHDQDEAFAMSDRIALMNQGEIVQQGAPAEIYQQPNSLFSLQFIGESSRLKIAKVTPIQGNQYLVHLVDGQCLKAQAQSHFDEQQVDNTVLTFRPEDTSLQPQLDSTPLKGHIESHVFKGDHQLVQLSLKHGEKFWARLPIDLKLSKNQNLEVHLRGSRALIFKQRISEHE